MSFSLEESRVSKPRSAGNMDLGVVARSASFSWDDDDDESDVKDGADSVARLAAPDAKTLVFGSFFFSPSWRRGAPWFSSRSKVKKTRGPHSKNEKTTQVVTDDSGSYSDSDGGERPQSHQSRARRVGDASRVADDLLESALLPLTSAALKKKSQAKRKREQPADGSHTSAPFFLSPQRAARSPLCEERWSRGREREREREREKGLWLCSVREGECALFSKTHPLVTTAGGAKQQRVKAETPRPTVRVVFHGCKTEAGLEDTAACAGAASSSSSEVLLVCPHKAELGGTRRRVSTDSYFASLRIWCRRVCRRRVCEAALESVRRKSVLESRRRPALSKKGALEGSIVPQIG